jgi:excisionase family DNA binding protein
MDHETKLFSITEFAKALSVTPACVRRWLFESKIAKIKLGRLVRIPASEADRLIAEGLRPARTAGIIPPALKPIIDVAEAHLRRKRQRSQQCDAASATGRKAK